MSIIIAIKDDKKIIIGCDSQVTRGHLKERLPIARGKVFEVKNTRGALMGVSGSLRDAQILSIQENLIDEIAIRRRKVDFEYIVGRLAGDVYAVLRKYDRIDRDLQGNLNNHTNNSYIFAYKDKAFCIGYDGAVTEINDYLCVGSGEEIAIGVLENNFEKPAKQRIAEAIKACSDKTIFVDNAIEYCVTK